MIVADPHLLVSLMRPRLREELPGHAAHARMAPDHRRDPGVHGVHKRDCREAGVLALLEIGDRPSFVLTIRKPDLTNHGGQISFPGGGCEEGETHIQAALRETYEEIGAPPSSYIIAGAMTPLFIPPSNFCVHPFLGVLTSPVDWSLDDTEVEALLHVPLDVLSDPASVKREARQIRDLRVTVPFYDVDGHDVWGATAMMLAEIVEVVENL